MLKRIIIGIGTIATFTIGMLFFSIYFNTKPTIFDQPDVLNNQIEVIEVGYVNWACDCADFYETKLYMENNNYELKAEDCIFIEPNNKRNQIPKNYFDTIYKNQNIKLIGQFYIKKGIPKSYEMKTSEKPEYAKIFRYSSYEYTTKIKKK